MKSQYDVIILGAGHNGLVAASYLGRAGLSVLLLEKNDYIGGATTSQKVFPDYDAQLSRYSYLVSLFPEKIIRDLGLKLELRRRATASFTPYLNHGQHDGLLLSNVDEKVSRQSMFELTGSNTEFDRMKEFYNLSRVFAEQVWDTMLGATGRERGVSTSLRVPMMFLARPGVAWWRNRSVARSSVICRTIWCAASFSPMQRSVF